MTRTSVSAAWTTRSHSSSTKRCRCSPVRSASAKKCHARGVSQHMRSAAPFLRRGGGAPTQDEAIGRAAAVLGGGGGRLAPAACAGLDRGKRLDVEAEPQGRKHGWCGLGRDGLQEKANDHGQVTQVDRGQPLEHGAARLGLWDHSGEPGMHPASRPHPPIPVPAGRRSS